MAPCSTGSPPDACTPMNSALPATADRTHPLRIWHPLHLLAFELHPRRARWLVRACADGAPLWTSSLFYARRPPPSSAAARGAGGRV